MTTTIEHCWHFESARVIDYRPNRKPGEYDPDARSEFVDYCCWCDAKQTVVSKRGERDGSHGPHSNERVKIVVSKTVSVEFCSGRRAAIETARVAQKQLELLGGAQ